MSMVNRVLDRELDRLKHDLLMLGGLVENIVVKAITAFLESNTTLAREVIEDDTVIDEKEVEIEEACLKILALHQPVAHDLRLIAVVMKVNNDLERMADSAVGIARRMLKLSQKTPVEVPENLKKMTECTISMAHDALTSFIDRDTVKAQDVCRRDDEVDDLHKVILKTLKRSMEKSPEMVSPSLDIFTITRRLERIADLATNIAEDVIYMVDGEIIRHGKNFPAEKK